MPTGDALPRRAGLPAEPGGKRPERRGGGARLLPKRLLHPSGLLSLQTAAALCPSAAGRKFPVCALRVRRLRPLEISSFRAKAHWLWVVRRDRRNSYAKQIHARRANCRNPRHGIAPPPLAVHRRPKSFNYSLQRNHSQTSRAICRRFTVRPAHERVKKLGNFHCNGRSAEEMA